MFITYLVVGVSPSNMKIGRSFVLGSLLAAARVSLSWNRSPFRNQRTLTLEIIISSFFSPLLNAEIRRYYVLFVLF